MEVINKMVNKKGFSLILIIALLFGLSAAGAGVYYYQKNKAESPSQLKAMIKKPSAGSESFKTSANGKEDKVTPNEEKYKSEIQTLLDKQCKALSEKNLKILTDTFDKSDDDLFRKYKTSVDLLLDMTDSVTKCRYEIKSVKISETLGKLTAETKEKDSLIVKLIDGSTKIFDNPSKINTMNYIKENNEWKQVIKIGDN